MLKHEYINVMVNMDSNIQTIMEMLMLMVVSPEMRIVTEIYAEMKMIKILVMDLLLYLDQHQSYTFLILLQKSEYFFDGLSLLIPTFLAQSESAIQQHENFVLEISKYSDFKEKTSDLIIVDQPILEPLMETSIHGFVILTGTANDLPFHLQ